MTGNPDIINIHSVSSCSGCGRSLEDISSRGYKRRQVFDLPPIEVEIT